MLKSYYIDLSTDSKIKNIRLKPDLLDPMSKANKTGINLMIFILKFVENCL